MADTINFTIIGDAYTKNSNITMVEIITDEGNFIYTDANGWNAQPRAHQTTPVKLKVAIRNDGNATGDIHLSIRDILASTTLFEKTINIGAGVEVTSEFDFNMPNGDVSLGIYTN